MTNECYDAILGIADVRNIAERIQINKPEHKLYLEQVVSLLEVFYRATKQLESDKPATISKVLPTVLNSLLELEDPQVNFFKLLVTKLCFSLLTRFQNLESYLLN